MLVAVVAAVAVAVASLVAWLVARRRRQQLTRELQTVSDERDRAIAAAAADGERADVANQERDHALDRLQRVEQEAAELADRLRDQATARAAALWALALGRVERAWRTSVAVHADGRSPLDGPGDPLRTAVGVVVDAAREDAGAQIDVEWDGADQVPDDQAVVVLAIVESVVAAVAKAPGVTTIALSAGPEGVDVSVRCGEGTLPPFAVPEALTVGPGRYRAPA